MAEISRAVFLSYASQDAQAVERICEALRAAGIEVWFDQSELRGGDAWDHRIREQIHACRLFIAVISANSEHRDEGYFRREWSLAVDRTRDMAHTRAFLVPVVIDGTPQRGASVPEKFHELQWTRLPGGETPPAFVERIQRLLSTEMGSAPERAGTSAGAATSVPPAVGLARGRWFSLGYIAIAVAALGLGYLALERSRESGPGVNGSASIAVLPLANESGDASQQYFSDGIAEDLITALSQFPGLKVIGRTSSFQFRESKDDSRSIGAKLGVAHLLEGSVRKSGDTIRVSAELIDTANGSTQWSERYDRPYKDLFGLQDEITREVVGALRAKLLPAEHAVAQSERPPSGSLEAYNAVLEGRFYYFRDTEEDSLNAIERFTRATQLDSHYAFAWSLLSRAWTERGAYHVDLAAAPQAFARARAANNTALSLAPDLASAVVARGFLLEWADLDWHGAEAAYRRALELDPANADAKGSLAGILAALGHMEPAIELTRQALAADPLNPSGYTALAIYLSALNRLDEAERAIRKAIDLQPGGVFNHFVLVEIEILRGNTQAALVAAQQEPLGSFFRYPALAEALQSGNDHAAANAALENLLGKGPSWDPFDVAEIYSMRNDADKTFEWLDRAWVYHDPGLHRLLYDPFIGRYKGDPRFAAFSRKVGLPGPARTSN